MNTFSANSLKVLDENVENFINRYILQLDFLNKNESAKRGERLHAMISYYIKGFEITKIKNNMPKIEQELLEKVLRDEIFKNKEKFIKSEENFLVKCTHKGYNFYLTGRFDAIFQDKDNYIIYDCDLQSIVYLYCGSKIFKTQNISICYYSLEKTEFLTVNFSKENNYFESITKVIDKLPKKYLT